MLIEWFLSIKSLPNLLFSVLCLPGDQSHPFAQPTINPLACCICWTGLLGRTVFPPWNEGPNFGSYTTSLFLPINSFYVDTLEGTDWLQNRVTLTMEPEHLDSSLSSLYSWTAWQWTQYSTSMSLGVWSNSITALYANCDQTTNIWKARHKKKCQESTTLIIIVDNFLFSSRISVT